MCDSAPSEPNGKDSLEDATSIDLGKILDLIGTKQTQYYALWAVYTAVQFSAGSYGMGREISYSLALVVLAGVWAFNLGHLSFVLHCVRQLYRLEHLLKIVITPGKPLYQEELRRFIDSVGETIFLWRQRPEYAKSYFWNIFVHLFIDICASLALLLRAGPSMT